MQAVKTSQAKHSTVSCGVDRARRTLLLGLLTEARYCLCIESHLRTMDRAAATIRMDDDHPHQSAAVLRSQVIADVNEGNVQAVQTALQSCESHIRDEVLTRAVYEDSVMKAAVEHHRTDIVKLLVNLAVMTPYPCAFLENALFHAISKGDEEMVQTLMTLGANVNYSSRDETPLLAACQDKNISNMEMLKNISRIYMLKKFGADVNGNLQACGGLDYIRKLVFKKTAMSKLMLCWLLDNGADINLQDKDGYTILRVAVEVGSKNLVKKLLGKQARVLPDNWGITPIFHAVDFGKIETLHEFMHSEAVSREEKVNALEYEAASLAPTHLEVAYSLLHRGLEERMKNPILFKPKYEPVAAFGGMLESQTLEELESKKDNNFAILMECLVVQHRLLGGGTGKMQKTPNFYNILNFLLSKKKYTEAMGLAEHGTGCTTSIWTEKIFRTLLKSQDVDNLSVIESGLSFCINVLRGRPSDVETYIDFSLKLLNRCIQLKLKQVREHAKTILRLFPLEGPRFCSALHAATYLIIIDKLDLLSYKAVVDLLVDCNADIDERDDKGLTVLAYVFHEVKPESRREIYEFLRQKGADYDKLPRLPTI